MPYVLTSVLLMAIVTYLPRVLPVAVFRRNIRSRFIKSFLKYVPYAVLGSLTFPDIFYSTDSLASALIGTAAALLLAYRGYSLAVVALGAILSVFLAGFFM